MSDEINAVRHTLQQFQDGYSQRNAEQLDSFMELFSEDPNIELIGVGAYRRSGPEWFNGLSTIREIVESDWALWGDVKLDVEGAQISVRGENAWLSTTGNLIVTQSYEKALPYYINQMKELLDREEWDLPVRLMEATQFGIERLRDLQRGVGFAWPFVFTAVLVFERDAWRFHTIHWSYPAK